MEQEIMRLSPSIARVLLARSPLHAWTQHRLGGNIKKEASEDMNEGRLIEAILYGLPMTDFVIIDADSFRTNKAKEERDLALAAGKIPVLASKLTEADAAAEPMRQALIAKGIDMDAGQSQARLEWQSLNPQAPGLGAGVACSGVLDKLIVDEKFGRVIIRDLKTTGDASPRAIQRKMVDMGYDIQHAAYTEAVQSIYPWAAGRVEFQFIYVERDEPHAVTIAELAGSMVEMGQRRWRRAVETWGRCVATNRWPDYSAIPVRIEALPWQLTQEAEQELDDIDRNQEG